MPILPLLYAASDAKMQVNWAMDSLVEGLPLYLGWWYGENEFLRSPLLMICLCILDSDTVNERNGEVERGDDKEIP